MKARLSRYLDAVWYQGRPGLTWLRPLSWLTAKVATRRLRRFRADAQRPPLPVLVVGNVTVGGTGKTPMVTALCAEAAARQLKVVIISRGYGAQPPAWPWIVTPEQDAAACGDEPLMLARLTGVPVIIDPQRARALAAAQALKPDLVISDDGLQHYALPRSAELVMLDGARGLGNGRCLPCGPLREPATRLQQVDWIVSNGPLRQPLALPVQTLTLEFSGFRHSSTGECLSPTEFAARHPRVHAMAGIGNPQRFFSQLRTLGLDVLEHPFADHHQYRAEDLPREPALPCVVTEKDAVKLAAIAEVWVAPVIARLPQGLAGIIIDTTLARAAG